MKYSGIWNFIQSLIQVYTFYTSLELDIVKFQDPLSPSFSVYSIHIIRVWSIVKISRFYLILHSYVYSIHIMRIRSIVKVLYFHLVLALFLHIIRVRSRVKFSRFYLILHSNVHSIHIMRIRSIVKILYFHLVLAWFLTTISWSFNHITSEISSIILE